MFKLIISLQAQNEIKRISKDHQKAIKLAILELREDPGLGKPLNRELAGRLTLKVGLYRIIYKVDEADRVIKILSAGHRAVVYK